ncbi:MAG TPA: cyclic nucleotide-binding domain-containing protein, partial [Spirochaetota bacterium]|nr:cyclic nucleotide-binding domain-containing protein [Spirochaetota bacterium]
LTDTSAGYLQVGSPPETVKDTMLLEKGVPGIFCLPNEFFNREKGISVAEIEFPIYFNFFIKKKKTIIICLAEYEQAFKTVLNESLFGPEEFNIKLDFDEQSDVQPPDLKAELAHFRGGLTLDKLVEFRLFDENREVRIDKVKVKLDNNDFLVEDKGYIPGDTLSISGEIKYNVTFDLGNKLSEPFQPPLCGITCLGPSHGFDPRANTSGFIIWVNRRGIMVDPPVNSTEWLVKSNVNPKLIDSIILTHTHADHDAGTFQKILEGDMVTLYTTKTVIDSWFHKYSALTRMPRKDLTKLFNYHPVLIGQKVNINGAWFRFHYSLHSVPTIGFRFSYRDKSFIYSSDHLNHPVKKSDAVLSFDELLQKKVLTPERYQELKNFPWETTDYIYHEAGVPPIHTPVSFLQSLPEHIKKKITVYHIAEKDFPEDKSLTLARFGIADSLIVNVEEGEFENAFQILDILSRVELFKHFSIQQTKDLLAVVQKEKISKGTRIITKGTYGDKFYIILSGSIRIGTDTVPSADDKNIKRYGHYQCFGERSLILNKPRSADVFADTDIEALSISKEAFLNLIEGTEAEKKLKHIALNRDQESWEALQSTELFNLLTSSQKTDLELVLHREEISKDTLLFQKNDVQHNLYIFHSGEAVITDAAGNDYK